MGRISSRLRTGCLVLGVALRSGPGVAEQAHASEVAAIEHIASNTRVAESILARLVANDGVRREEIRIPPLPELEALAAEPGVELWIDLPVRNGRGSSLPVSVILLRDGQVLRRSAVTARVVAERAVLVAARPLAPGTTLRADDVSEALRSDAPADALGVSADVIGQRVVRSVAAGAPLRETMLRAVPFVRRGQAVRLRATRSGLEIEAAGRALEDGQPGAMIRVMNLASRRVLAGQVAADGSIEMGF